MTSTIQRTKSDQSEIRLSTQWTVSDYKRDESQQSRSEIADFHRDRLRERYITPIETSTERNGFAIMALACLLIETLEAFEEGIGDTHRKSRKMFKNFFARQNGRFPNLFRNGDFYEGVRCGILHQGGTTKGWRILRNGPLFDSKTKTINAATFMKVVAKSLDDQCRVLKSAPWESTPWKNFRNKMDFIISHCSE